MNDELHIWLPVDGSLPWHWRHGQAVGLAIDAPDKLALGERGAKDVRVIIPGQNIRILELNLPKLRESEQLSAAGFAIEDKIAAPLTDQHIVVAAADQKRVAVVSEAIMSHTLLRLEDAGLIPSGLYADFDVLTGHTDPVLLPDRCVYPGRLGYAMDRGWAGIDTEEQTFATLSASINLDGALNLLTGTFTPKSRTVVNWKQFSRLAALLLISGLVGLAWLGTQSRARLKQAEHIRSETARMYTDFTGQSAPVNPALSVTRAIKSSGETSSDFMSLAGLLFRAVERVDGVTVETLQFDDDQNQLSLRLHYPGFESGTALESAVRDLGGDFKAGGVREQSGRLIGDGVMTMGAGS